MRPDWRIRPATTSDRDALITLAADVIASRPAYAPGVSGRAGAEDWMFRKHLDWARVLLIGGQIVGHVGAKHHRALPDGSAPPEGHDAELCRLMVHPRWQRRGIASLLLDAVHAEYGHRLWATVTPDGPSHRLLATRGWGDFCDAWFPDEGAYGRIVASRELGTGT